MTLSKTPSGPTHFHDASTGDTIDVEEGVARLMGNRELYARMLRRFRRTFKDDVNPIRSAITAGDKSQAHRLAISLVGASGMIGARRLYQGACELEEAIRNDSADQMEILAFLTIEFKQVLDSLDVLLEGSPP